MTIVMKYTWITPQKPGQHNSPLYFSGCSGLPGWRTHSAEVGSAEKTGFNCSDVAAKRKAIAASVQRR